jgi:hypothetical protein
MNELETRLARIIANTLAQLDGVPTEVEIEDGYAYVKRHGAAHRTRYVFPPEAYDGVASYEEYGGPGFPVDLLAPVNEEPTPNPKR